MPEFDPSIPAQRSFSLSSFLNFAGNTVVLGLAFLTLPFIVGRLGEESFGLLAILWLFIGYANMLDIGVGQATVKFLAESIGLNDKKTVIGLARTSILLSLGIGILGGTVLFTVSFTDFPAVLNISDSLRGKAISGLRLIALIPPAVLLHGSLKSILIAFHRFDLSNGILILNGFLQWGGSVAVLALGGDLTDVILFTVVARFVTLLPAWIFSVGLLPEIRVLRVVPGRAFVSTLIRFGGWVSVSQTLAPVFSFLERFLISGLLSLSVLAFYSVPNDIIVRFLVVPMSLVTTLVPFMSGRWVNRGERDQMKLLYQRALKFTFLLMVPIAAVLGVFSENIMTAWLGREFAEQSSGVLELLSAGLLFNAMAQLPVAGLQALGRPDIPSKLILLELPLYVVLCYLFTAQYGIIGTAAAWTIRVAVEASILTLLAHRAMKSVLIKVNFSYLWKSLVLSTVFIGGVTMFKDRWEDIYAMGGAIATALFLYGLGTWFAVLDGDERVIVIDKVRLLRPKRRTH